jgi:hypothetical protein
MVVHGLRYMAEILHGMIMGEDQAWIDHTAGSVHLPRSHRTVKYQETIMIH